MVTRMPGTDARTHASDWPGDPVPDTRFSVVRVAETGSTNADLLAAAADGAPDGAVLTADHQSAGRGRRGRSWEAPPGSSLLMSVLLRPDLSPARVAVLTAAVGLAARHACAEIADVTPTLKWPNDLMVVTDDGDRKLGGILAESRLSAATVDSVVVGLGLNVAWPETVPDELTGLAVALNHLRGDQPAVDRQELLTAMLVDLERRLGAIDGGDDEAVWSEWRTSTSTLGRRVRVETGRAEIIGLAVGITGRGRLLIDSDDGEQVEVDVGDVIHLRPAPS
jgi:BirA family biotin operon repressor/biotin-[acetyl-CoA-carboxylase] ligase